MTYLIFFFFLWERIPQSFINQRAEKLASTNWATLEGTHSIQTKGRKKKKMREGATLKRVNKWENILDQMTIHGSEVWTRSHRVYNKLWVTFKDNSMEIQFSGEKSSTPSCQELQRSCWRRFPDFLKQGCYDFPVSIANNHTNATSSVSSNIAPSKFTLKQLALGGFHLILRGRGICAFYLKIDW